MGGTQGKGRVVRSLSRGRRNPAALSAVGAQTDNLWERGWLWTVMSWCLRKS